MPSKIRDMSKNVFPVRLLALDAPAWAEQLARLIVSIQTPGGVSPVMSLSEAMDFTGCGSSSAFYGWLERWAPQAPCSHGKYTRSALDIGRSKQANSTRPPRRPSKRVAKKNATAQRLAA
jgi:hypothetical protein